MDFLIAGEQVKAWQKIITPAEFILEIHEFLDRYSLSEQARNPIGSKNKIKKDFDMMTEEQMEAALAARDITTQETSPTPEPIPFVQPLHTPLPLTDEPTIPTSTSSATDKSPSLFLSIAPSDAPEPPESPQTTRATALDSETTLWYLTQGPMMLLIIT